jgi:hypothetical protein
MDQLGLFADDTSPPPAPVDDGFAARLAALAAAIDAEPDEAVEWPINARTGQALLFQAEERYDEYWQGMPEFVQPDQKPWKTLHVHFKDDAALRAFAVAVGRALTVRTRSIWYPQAEEWHYMDKRWRSNHVPPPPSPQEQTPHAD